MWCRLTLAACYQLAQFVLKIGFALAKKVGKGEVGVHSHDMLCTWQLPWLAVEQLWLALAGPLFNLLAPIVQKPLLSPCRSTISGSVENFQSGRAFAGQDH